MAMKQNPAPRPAAAPKPKKPPSSSRAALLTAFVFLLLLGGAAACLWFNVGGAAEMVLPLLPEYKASLDALEQEKAALALEKQKLAQQADALASAEKTLEQRDADLTRREDKLKSSEAALDAKLADAKTEEERRRTLVTVYTAMEPAKAAAMLDEANTLQEAAAILKLLPEDSIAAILSELGPKKALELSKLLLQ